MKYNFVNEPVRPKTVTVLTPTIGSPKLQDAINSVEAQTYEHVQHLCVVDGPDYWEQVMSNVDVDREGSTTKFTFSPENTGKAGGDFYGHRIYAAYPHLINTDYIFFLDEDNWYYPNHVESLVKVLETNDFAYSLRKIYDKDKNYICRDNCESLGKWPIYLTHNTGKEQYLIDTSAFAFRREFLIKVSRFWHHGWGGDRNFFYNVKDNSMWDTNGKHTLCYRLDGNINSVTSNFFDRGNKKMESIYGEKFPWIKD
jgi:glycosyltransferase involved in cell wall biosynthesis